MELVKQFIKHRSTFHTPGQEKNVFLFSTPRSGSTWLTEIIAAQPGFKMVKEPFNLRNPVVSDSLGLHEWEEIFDPKSRDKIYRYVHQFLKGKDTDLRWKRPAPFSDLWHLRTNRIIFKILFAGEDYIGWFQEKFDGQIVYLLRHPIPVSFSRSKSPRLESFLNSEFRNNLNSEELRFAKKIQTSGSDYERAVLDWTLQNLMPLRQMQPDWLLISYEQLVLESEKMVGYMVSKLGFKDPDQMLSRINKASASSRKSEKESQSILLDPEQIKKNRRWLIEKWKAKVSPEEEKRTFEILEAFGVDHYQYGDFEMNRKYQLI
ncbi:MAG: sulfotransferase [Bacteroidia bacterium]|nr:sulfotransferase [Bacteroidia bacterium]